MSALSSFIWAVVWSCVTILAYMAAKQIYGRWPRIWFSPLVVAPAFLIALALLTHERYSDYIHGTRWLVMLLGPATVAFSVPIYEQREAIRKNWIALAVGAVVGSSTAIASAWLLASVLSVDGALRLSLLPRSVSTPFAMAISNDIGGVPDLTAVFVVITGVFGTVAGEVILRVVPFRSALARGALFGMGAHGAGVAKAHQVGTEEGTIAGLVMVLVGLTNVLAAPLLRLIVS
jgi:predicted murein hydrolase (TIGR00659 family)